MAGEGHKNLTFPTFRAGSALLKFRSIRIVMEGS